MPVVPGDYKRVLTVINTLGFRYVVVDANAQKYYKRIGTSITDTHLGCQVIFLQTREHVSQLLTSNNGLRYFKCWSNGELEWVTGTFLV